MGGIGEDKVREKVRIQYVQYTCMFECVLSHTAQLGDCNVDTSERLLLSKNYNCLVPTFANIVP